MRIQSPYSFLIAHLDRTFTDSTSLRYKTEERLKNFCKNLTKVVNASESYNKLVSNSSGSRIRGDLKRIKKLSKKLPRKEEEIIASIDKAKSRGIDLTCHSQTQEKIFEEISNLESMVKVADLLTLGLAAPEPSTINIAHEKLIIAQAYLYEFINERKIFNYFSNHGYYPNNAPARVRNNIAVNRVLPSAPLASNHDLPWHYSEIPPGDAPPSYEQAMQQGQNQRFNFSAGHALSHSSWSMNRI